MNNKLSIPEIKNQTSGWNTYIIINICNFINKLIIYNLYSNKIIILS